MTAETKSIAQSEIVEIQKVEQNVVYWIMWNNILACNRRQLILHGYIVTVLPKFIAWGEWKELLDLECADDSGAVNNKVRDEGWIWRWYGKVQKEREMKSTNHLNRCSTPYIENCTQLICHCFCHIRFGKINFTLDMFSIPVSHDNFPRYLPPLFPSSVILIVKSTIS